MLLQKSKICRPELFLYTTGSWAPQSKTFIKTISIEFNFSNVFDVFFFFLGWKDGTWPSVSHAFLLQRRPIVATATGTHGHPTVPVGQQGSGIDGWVPWRKLTTVHAPAQSDRMETPWAVARRYRYPRQRTAGLITSMVPQ